MGQITRSAAGRPAGVPSRRVAEQARRREDGFRPAERLRQCLVALGHTRIDEQDVEPDRGRAELGQLPHEFRHRGPGKGKTAGLARRCHRRERRSRGSAGAGRGPATRKRRSRSGDSIRSRRDARPARCAWAMMARPDDPDQAARRREHQDGTGRAARASAPEARQEGGRPLAVPSAGPPAAPPCLRHRRRPPRAATPRAARPGAPRPPRRAGRTPRCVRR